MLASGHTNSGSVQWFRTVLGRLLDELFSLLLLLALFAFPGIQPALGGVVFIFALVRSEGREEIGNA